MTRIKAPLVDELQRKAFEYFRKETNSANGLIADKTQEGAPASIAATGFALAAYTVGVERGWMTRTEAVRRTLTTLRFFEASPQNTSAHATGYRGFYYHFLDMVTGRRAGRCELSTVDTTFLLAGMLTAAEWFDGNSSDERAIRALADALFRRADWHWAQNGGAAITHGWRPEKGFLRARWRGYDEALLLYVLGLGSPTYPLPVDSYAAWSATYRWTRLYGHTFLYGSSFFLHQFSHLFIDFRGIQDAFMREKGIDYFENSRRATLVQREYAIRNPHGFKGYGPDFWGLTATEGPGRAVRTVDGVRRRFFGYAARGVPYGPDDGTIAPWSLVASLPFAPEIVRSTLTHLRRTYPDSVGPYGFSSGINLTFSGETPAHYGVNLGPVVLMPENVRSDHVWRLMRNCPPVVTGLKRAGFSGGWLGPV